MSRILAIHVPVIHRGYLDLFKRLAPTVREVAVFGDELIRRLRFFEHDISALSAAEAAAFVKSLGLFETVRLLEPSDIDSLRSRPLCLINDQLSRRFAEQFLKESDIQWDSVFLRWDESHVHSASPVTASRQSSDPSDRIILAEAYREAKKSGDWWRQVGAILAEKGSIQLRAYNQDMPDDQSSYRLGNIRDYLKPGERPDLSNSFHAENWIIAEAARRGIRTEGLDLYVTHFPCSVCAKAIATAGIRRCFFGEGSSNFDAETMLRAHAVEIIHLPRDAS